LAFWHVLVRLARVAGYGSFEFSAGIGSHKVKSSAGAKKSGPRFNTFRFIPRDKPGDEAAIEMVF
jgi:hypothetical protein